MLDALRRRASSAANASSSSDRPPAAPPASSPRPHGSPKPYDTPMKDGRCGLLELPDEVLARIFTRLDRASLTYCFRLCKTLHDLLLSNSSIALHHTLLCNSLTLNPNVFHLSANLNHIPPSSSTLLSTLRERLTRFRNLQPKSVYPLEFKEREGHLYEYLEGMLLRGIGPRIAGRSTAREIAFYDMRKLADWEDEPAQRRSGPDDTGSTQMEDEEGDSLLQETTESEAGQDVRTVKKFDFEIAEFAIDPGMDLLVVVEVKATGRGRYSMSLHLLSLTTLEPHPLARQPILQWPDALTQPRVSLGFQICDDGLYVLKHNTRGGRHDHIYGWQWTTGRLAVVLKALPTMSLESFVLLSPSSFVVPTIITHLDPLSNTQDDLTNLTDMSWTHHLHIFAFPPLSTAKIPESSSEPLPPPHKAIHIATIDLPAFHVDIFNNIPPPRLTIRTDPPPRRTFPTHPIGAVSQFCPDPDSGIIVMEIHCQLPNEEDPHYVMILHKSFLAKYLPAPTSPLLRQAFPRPAPVVAWRTLAPHARIFGPDLIPSSWVCYVYQNRYVTPRVDREATRSYLRLYDFDPLRVRKELYDRAVQDKTCPLLSSSPVASPRASWRKSFSRRQSSMDTSANDPLEGDRDGIVLVTSPTITPPDRFLTEGLTTGSLLPHIYAERPTRADVTLIDGERIISVENHVSRWNEVISAEVEVMDF